MHHGRLRDRRGAALATHVGSVARVAQARRGDLARVDRAEGEALLELGAAGQDAPVLVDGEAVPVEDELVLAADGVDEHDRGQVVDGALREHALPGLPVADAVGGGGQVDDHLGARQRLRHRRRPRLPDVLADAHPDRDPVELEDGGLCAALEVALLVEDAVVGQVHLAVDGRDLAVGEHRRGVVDVLGALGKADQRHDPARARGQLVKRRGRLLEEGRLQQQVLGWVAAQRQLGEDDQRGARVASRRGLLGDLRGVAVDVAHGRVDLRQRDPQQVLSRGHASIIATGSRDSDRDSFFDDLEALLQCLGERARAHVPSFVCESRHATAPSPRRSWTGRS